MANHTESAISTDIESGLSGQTLSVYTGGVHKSSLSASKGVCTVYMFTFEPFNQAIKGLIKSAFVINWKVWLMFEEHILCEF